MRFVKPLDVELLERIAAEHHLIVTVEEHQVMGGAGSAVCEALTRLKAKNQVLLLGLPDRFVDHGDPAKLLASLGLDAAGIENSVRNAMSD
jgi:1-deoxy-D-xylulose-5-phosphate synthase